VNLLSILIIFILLYYIIMLIILIFVLFLLPLATYSYFLNPLSTMMHGYNLFALTILFNGTSRQAPLSCSYCCCCADRVEGGIFHDCAVHDIDIVCWILGDFPVSVYTVAHAHNEDIAKLNDVDTVVISMKFRSGILAVIDLSRYAAYGYDQRVEVECACASSS